MTPGKILIEWDADGKLAIKTSLPVGGDGKKLSVRVLLDAAKALNDAEGSLVLPPAPVRILAGA